MILWLEFRRVLFRSLTDEAAEAGVGQVHRRRLRADRHFLCNLTEHQIEIDGHGGADGDRDAIVDRHQKAGRGGLYLVVACGDAEDLICPRAVGRRGADGAAFEALRGHAHRRHDPACGIAHNAENRSVHDLTAGDAGMREEHQNDETETEITSDARHSTPPLRPTSIDQNSIFALNWSCRELFVVRVIWPAVGSTGSAAVAPAKTARVGIPKIARLNRL